MIEQSRLRDLRRVIRAYRRAETRLETLRSELLRELLEAHEARPGASLQELGDLMGVSRQRIHQLVEEARGL